MATDEIRDFDDLVVTFEGLLDGPDLPGLTQELVTLKVPTVLALIERLSQKDRAIVYRLLPKAVSIEVFEELAPSIQSEIVDALNSKEVAEIFSGLDPADRVGLIDELPASVAQRLLKGLTARERSLTSEVLGYPQGSIGRRMSPEFVAIRQNQSVAEALRKIKKSVADAETVYTLPVIDSSRKLVGVVSLRDLLATPGRTKISKIMEPAQSVSASEDEEFAARTCADLKLLALPVVDNESRLLGIITVDDALRILEQEESEDAARIGGAEPLRRPYLSTPVFSIVQSRVVWLLVLALGATLTVSIMGVFEQALEQLVVLSLFIPLLIGLGGNTGNQAATTVTRALALQEIRTRDIGLVLFREFRVGVVLGLLLGTLAFGITYAIFGLEIATVIGLTLLSICVVAAALGGVMPLIGLALRADPAVFSNPFITTVVDTAGLVIYFLIATAVLGI